MIVGLEKLMYTRSFKMLPTVVLDIFNLKATIIIVIIPKSVELSVNYCQKKNFLFTCNK